ncbi:multicopper oxidase family protein [Actinopolymorpha singaporensis]|uniref:Multicopper oxidase CueO n=1 Tax=Actinopolymorpha singaporensis TaxID=117157 RepID=A0A1H1XVS6_9ACTN|nr:multicopper oxidase family protein [Actinopolymorpha singaporensis]SDT12866.1 Tat (twin-arginine translocation) pathway signal sequence [Actinopolymorpha singaporensis]
MSTALSRRGFLGLVGAAGAAGAAGSFGLAGCGRDTTGQTAQLLTSLGPTPRPYAVPLPVPAVKKPLRSDATTDYYEIVQRVADVEILPGLRTPILGYDGTFPGPTLVSRSGRRTVVRHRNTLPVPTVVHLHGGHTPPDHDGYPVDLLLPAGGWNPGTGHGHGAGHGASPTTGSMAGDVRKGVRDYAYPFHQRAATLWYHDHRMDFTGAQVYRGLAGFHLVHDDEEQALPLPSGERDVPLMICDRAFEEDGAFRYPALDRELRSTPGVTSAYMEGVLGDVILVNGAPWPVMEVAAARYRFRILNASNARRYRLALDPGPREGAPFVQVGGDGGLLEHPLDQDTIVAAPAERFDVVVDFSAYRPGTLVTMVNQLGSGPTARVMRFRVTGRVKDDSAIPARLARIEKLDPAKAVRTREWRFSRGDVHGEKGWTINGRPFDARRMDARPRLGDIEIWRFQADLHHPVHVHLDPFQVVRRGNRGPGRFDAGWKDTVDLRPTEYVDVAVRFTDYTGPYLLHCHNLEHEDMAMMAAFATT